MSRVSFPLCVLVLVLPLQAQEVRSFHYGDQGHAITASPGTVVVGYETTEVEVAASDTLARHSQTLRALTLVLAPHRVALFSLHAETEPTAALAGLRSDPAHTFANRVYHLGDEANPDSMHLLTRDLCVGLARGAKVSEVAAQVGAAPVRSFAFPGTWLLRLPAGSRLDALEAAEELRRHPEVHFAHPDWLRRLAPREMIPNDPLFANQWHLKNTGQGGGVPGADVKATFAWDLTTGDPSTIICIIDTGVERSHVDILQTPNGYNALCGAGPLMGDPVPTGCSSSYAGSHGTSCAGVAAARINNATGVAGVAGSCTIMPINLLGSGLGYGTPSMEAACFDYATANGAGVISNSWGPDGVPWPLPALVQASFINSVTNGRGGLGCCIFWAGGNGNELITSDGYASSPYTMAVGASTNFDLRASYSDYGPELDFVAPSNGGSLGISTTSTNSSGSSNYTSGFGGTSSASPLAAGIAALLISQNPTLSWTQVRDILRNTAVQINPSSVPGAANYYDPTTGHSSWYGHGRVDAYQALLAAGSPTSFLYTVSSNGTGNLDLQVVNAPANAELFIPVSLDTSIPQGSGPVLGLGADAFFTLLFPLGTDPFHVLANATGSYSLVLPSGSLPAGLAADSRCLALNPGLVLAEMSPVRRTLF